MKLQSILLVTFLCLGPIFAIAQESQESYFVATLGNDTVAVESFKMDAQSIRGTSITRIPRTTSRSYEAKLNGKDLLESFSVTYSSADGKTHASRKFRYWDDSVQVAMTQDGSTKESSAKVSGRPYPFIADIFGPWNFAIRSTMHAKDKKEFSILAGTRTLPYEIRGTMPGKLELANPNFGPIYATVDKDGSLERFDMTATTDKFMVERIAQLDVDAVGKRFAEREQSGVVLGILSPRDTAHATVGGADIIIDYGSPAMRGRKIFGNVVAWNVVWRLGANAATQLTTDKTVQFGSTAVESGTYSLFALPSEGTWMLIVNRQHGQWGTVYDQSKDLVRLPLATKHLAEPVERFTFTIGIQGNQGILKFKWETTEASIPFTVR